MATGDITLSNGTVITASEVAEIASEVKALLAKESKDPSQYEQVQSLANLTTLPALLQNGSAYKLVRVAVDLLKGLNGTDGKEVSLRKTDTAIQWQLGSNGWQNLVPISDLKGEQGLTGAGSHVEQDGTKVRFGRSEAGQTSVTWDAYAQLKGADSIYQWDGTSLKMGTRTYTVDGSTEEYTEGVDLKGATGQGVSYRWSGTSLQLGTIPVGGSETTWGASVDLKGEQGLRGVHGTDLEYVWEGTSLKLGRITYSEDGTGTLVFGNPVDLQGNRGEQGLQPAMQMGDVTTLNPEDTASATFVKDGTTTEGADIYKLNLSIPRGMTGKEGMPRIPSAVLSLTSESTSDEIFAAWGGKEAMIAVGTSFLAGEKSICLMSGNATLYFAYTDADNFSLDILFRLEGKDKQYEHRVVGGVATLTVKTYDNVHVNNASTMVKGKQYAFEPDTDGSASGVMKEVTVITQEEKDKINGTYSKEEIDSTFATKANTYTKDETYTKEEVEAKIPTLVDAYSKTESDERYPQKDGVYPKGETYSKKEVDAKIPTVVDVYSKTESDERYPLKNNVYTKEETYTKNEVDAKIPAPVDAYTKTEADSKFALLSSQPYFFNPSVLNSVSTNASYPASDIAGLLGMTLREFVANYGDRIVFKEYMGALAYNQDSAGTLAEFTYYVNDKIRVVKIIHEDADTTCNVTVTEKQLVTNIVAISESNYATASKDPSTLYLVY